VFGGWGGGGGVFTAMKLKIGSCGSIGPFCCLEASVSDFPLTQFRVPEERTPRQFYKLL